jgi:aminoglycoside N3'-acetyltransferase
MLGTENNSMIHYVQDKVNFPNLFLSKIYNFKYKNKTIKTKIHHPDGSIKYICNGKPCSDVQFLVKMYKDERFNENNYMKTIKIGKAVCHLINTQDFVRIATKYLGDNIKKYKEEYYSLIKDDRRC